MAKSKHRRVVYRNGAMPTNSHAINVPVQMVMLRDYADSMRATSLRLAAMLLAAGADPQAVARALVEVAE